jgi:dTDP-4-dehydrorhamnose reductase
MKIAITGSTGLVGTRIVELLQDTFEFIPLLQREIDITQQDSVHKTLSNISYDVLLHLAAYTNVDAAETEKDTAYGINVKGTQHLFDITKQKNAKFIYISTGFVFDGINPPYYEDSPPNPVSIYGQTKFQGEEIVKDNAMIVRFEYPYRSSFDPKKDFVRTVKSLLEQKRSLTMVNNSLMTPTFIDDIAYALKYLLQNYSEEIFHIVGTTALSPYDCGKQIAKTFGLDESLVQPTTYERYFAGKAKRPQWADVRSKKNTFYKMKSFEEGLQYIHSQQS